MKKNILPKKKILALAGIVILYVCIGIIFKFSVVTGVIEKSPAAISNLEGNDTIPEIESGAVLPNLEAAQGFFLNNFVRNNGHIDLYIAPGKNINLTDEDTNSEAVSYYLLWTAKAKDKKAFDKELEFIKSKMTHPVYGYLMWRLEPNDTIVTDGSNIATDADIRAINALLIAEKQWNDKKYSRMIDMLAEGIEKMAITSDGMLAPYGGVSGESSRWKTEQVWLSYSDFTVFNEMSKRRGKLWSNLYSNMKKAVLNGQIANGLYNSQLTELRKYGNGIDGGGYSINSMWIMVRSAESNDSELMRSANKSLKFYKDKFEQDAEIYAMYSSNGDSMSPADTPWAYALVGRAAIALGDNDFGHKMIRKLLENQVTDSSSELFGAFPEGYGSTQRVGQFTMQESILTIQDFLEKSASQKLSP